MQNHISIDAITYAQPGGVFYACTLPAINIVNRLDIRRRQEDPVHGVQRADNPSRVRDITSYALQPNAIFPTPIIVSAYPNGILFEDGKLLIPNGHTALGHVLDGQHRLLGLKALNEDELKGFDLMIVFVFGIDLYSEATIFSTINSTQKQVSKSLMYDLFSLNPGRSIEKTAHEIVRSLNDDRDSPFYGRIKLLGKKMSPDETLSQAAFVDQISRQIKDQAGVLNEYYQKEQDWLIRKIISNCFSALVKAQGVAKNEAFPPDYFFRTTGFGGVAQSLGDLMRVGKNHKNSSEKFFKPIFEELFAQLKEPPEGVGNAAMLRIKEAILLALSSIKISDNEPQSPDHS
jgi:DGQHR domain-containing protein